MAARFCWKVGIFAQAGPFHEMQDKIKVIENISQLNPGITTECAYLGIFDGHGGPAAAQYLQEKMHEELILSKIWESTDIKESLSVTFLKVDGKLLNYLNATNDSSGSCALVSLIMQNKSTKQRKLIVANTGDSRAVLLRKQGTEVLQLTTDHKAGVETEKSRIRNSGGFVNGGRLFGILAVSRAFGDKDFKNHENTGLLIAIPEVTEILLQEDDTFLVKACDGVWDVLSNQDVCTIVNRALQSTCDLNRICAMIVQEAVNRGSCDDISVILVALQEPCILSHVGISCR